MPRYSSEDIHRALFPKPPKRRTLAELKEAIRRHARERAIIDGDDTVRVPGNRGRHHRGTEITED